MKYRRIPIIALLVIVSCSNPSGMTAAIQTPGQLSGPTVVPTASFTPIPTLSRTPVPTYTSTPFPSVDPQVSTGDYHTCYLSSIGKVECWGWNKYGQSGLEIGEENVLPGNWLDLDGFAQISAGAYHTCAVTAAHQVYCWGRNNSGQLGNGTTTDSQSPTIVIGLEGAKIDKVVSGSLHTCAFEIGRKAWCWGSNRDGKLGNSTPEFISTRPVEVSAPVSKTADISLGATFTCAAGTDGEAWCWGDGSFGQTGNNNPASNTAPQMITTLPTAVVRVSSGWFHTCALAGGDSIMCWGKNYEGELGNSSTVSRADAAHLTGIKDGTTFKDLDAGGRTTCALTTDSQVYCWGKNDYGQLGIRSLSDYLYPMQVSELQDEQVTSIAVGASHVCALTKQNKLWCWGANDHLQLGKDSIELVNVPIQIEIP